MAAFARSDTSPRQDADLDLRAGTVAGAPKALLRLEGLGVLAISVFAYAQLGAGWWMFAMLFLVPDLSMLGYAAGPRAGAFVYNLGHFYLMPVALGVAGITLSVPVMTSVALIWIAHIGFDRAVGYGLKYADAFKHTHLGLPFARAA